MDLLKTLLSQANLEDIAKSVGFDAADLQKVVAAIGPTLTKASSGQSADQILALFSSSDVASKLQDGNFIEEISKATGIDVTKLTQSLPGIVSALTAKFQQGGLNSIMESFGSESAKSIGTAVTALLDKDKDGQIADDLLDAAKKLF